MKKHTVTYNDIPPCPGVVVSKKHGMMPAVKYRLFMAVKRIEKEKGK
jgi:hypothetical protein